MNLLFCRLIRPLVAAIVGIGLSISVWSICAQDEPAPKAKARPRAAAKARAAGEGASVGRTNEKPADLTPPEDPAVAALLSTNPSTPSDLFRMAQTLSRLQRPELAKGFLQKIVLAKLDDGQLASLADEYNTSSLTEMANQSALMPEAEELAQEVLGAVSRRSQDPQRIEGYIKQLQDPSQDVRATALIGLQNSHAAGVAALIAALADSQRANEYPGIQAALVALRGDSYEPVVRILDGADPHLKLQLIGVLGEMKVSSSAIFLLAPALSDKSDPRLRAAAASAIVRLIGTIPSKASAVDQLVQQARAYFDGRQVIASDVDGRAALWNWDATARRCVVTNVAVEDAVRVMAARLARDAASLAPGDRHVLFLSMTTALEQAVRANGLDRRLDFEKDPVVLEAAALGPKTIEALLAADLTDHRYVAARAAAEILGHLPQSPDLIRSGAEPTPLVRAVREPDRRLRMAALEAIVRLHPDAPFAGSSNVLESLVFFASTKGVRRALLAGPSDVVFQEWVGLLSALHIATDFAPSGREAVRMALACPDYEMALLDPGILNSGIDMVLQQLRQDYRTARLRTGLIARAGYFEKADRLARDDMMSMAFARPHSADAVQWQLAQLMTVAPREFVGFQERQDEAIRALDCLAILASTSKKLYDFRPYEGAIATGLFVPRLAPRVAAVLTNIGTPTSQTSLVELASRSVEPLEVRQIAAKALGVNVRKFGLLLSEDAVVRQYERYNGSGNQDVDAQNVLGTVLDVIESRISEKDAARAANIAAKSAERPRAGAPGRTRIPHPMKNDE